MNVNDLITIVIPVRDRAKIVERTLDSVAQQDFRPIKLIIVDNGSTDNTAAVIEQWVKKHQSSDFTVQFINEPTAGATYARNRGLDEVTTPYVMFFDSDDTMEYDHLSNITKELCQYPDTDILHWSMAIIDADGWRDKKHSSNPKDLLTEQILHSTLSTQRYCIKTEILRSAGAWKNPLKIWDDYELGIRLLSLTPALTTRLLHGTPRVNVFRWDKSITGLSFSSRAAQIATALEEIDKLLVDKPYYQLIFAARKVILAASYRREGSTELADKLLSQTLTGLPIKTRLKLKILYATQLIAGCGASSLTPFLFKKQN